jgi:predicted small secreted protein
MRPANNPATVAVVQESRLAMRPALNLSAPRRSILARLVPVAALIGATVALSACDDTIRGIGRDIKDTGRAIEDATS